MSRYIDPDLKDFLRREDSYAEYAVEISAPDVECVLRRAADQFFTTPPLVSMTPAAGLAQAPSGGLEIAPTPVSLASASGSDITLFDLNTEDPTNRMKGVIWNVGANFARARIRNFKATIAKDVIKGTKNDFSLQIYRITRTPGVMENYNAQKNQYFTDAFTSYVFTPLLSTAPVIKDASINYVSNVATLNFDLSGYALNVENTPIAASSAGSVGELPAYLFVVSALGLGTVTGRFHWPCDTSGVKNMGTSIGTFQRSWWGRGPGYTGDNSGVQWVPSNFNDCPSFEIDIDTYAATAQGVYALDLGRVPSAGTLGRAVLEQQLPHGTSATLELATAGSSGPWTPAKNGDVIAVAQQHYWARITLNSDSAFRSSAITTGFGIEFRAPYDVSEISVLSLPNRDVSLPDMKASIADATLRIIREGERDYLDLATTIGSTKPTSKLEADIFLRSRHPLILSDRSKWLRMERLAVDDREPNKVSETLSLLSIAKKLKAKVPPLLETVNTVHTVTSSTGTAVDVSPSLVGTIGGGHDYNNLGYYMRVRSSTANIPAGFVVTIAGSTGTNELDFNSGDLPNALAVGDVIEVHSGIVAAQPLSWQNADPADVWYDIFVAAGFPTDRIGSGELPRSGFPPRVTDFAPGDAATQGKRLVTMQLTGQETADELLDQISFIMGGATVERNGQMCFVQIYPGRALDGTVTVPLSPIAAVFDARDIVANSLKTNPQITSRLVTVTGKYGVNNAAADPTLYPTRTTNATDADALAWLTQQDLEFVGAMDLDDKITRWLYNTNDAGQYLASVVCAQVVRACSTGIRNFPFSLREKYPEVTIGDSVVIITDQYTDYDPSLSVPIAGTIALKGVVVHVGSGGGDFSVFVGGLSDNVQGVGGKAGALTGLGTAPAQPALQLSFDSGGVCHAVASGDPLTASLQIALSTVSLADALAHLAGAPVINAQNGELDSTGTIAFGTTIYAAAVGTSGTAVVGQPIATSAVRGNTAAPSLQIVPSLTCNQIDDTTSPVTLSASASNLPAVYTWAIRRGYSKGQYVSTPIWSGSNSSSPLTQTESVTPQLKNSYWFQLDIAVGSDHYYSECQVQGLWAFINPSTGQASSGAQTSTGAAVNRSYAKPLSSSPDNADSINDGLTFGGARLAYLDSGRPNALYDSTAAIQVPATTVSANLAVVSNNLLTNGGGQVGALGVQATGWTKLVGADMVPTITSPYVGDRSFVIDHLSTSQSSSHRQQFTLVAGRVYRLRAAIQQAALTGSGAFAMVRIYGPSDVASEFTLIDLAGTRTSQTDNIGFGIVADGTSGSAYVPVQATFICNASGTWNVEVNLGLAANCTGEAFYDDIVLEQLSSTPAVGGYRGSQALDSNYRVVGQTTLPMTRTGNVGSSQGGVNPVTVSWNSGAGLWQANISSHSLYHGASSPTFYNSGSVLLPAFNTSYYIYADDPNYLGGSVTYSVVASNLPSTIVGGEGRYFVGSATSGSSGGGGSGSAGGGGGTGGACFEGDTLIAMAGGNFRPIAAIREGDRVVSFDPSTGALGTKRVTGVMVHEVKRVLAIESDGARVVTTAEHPFYMLGGVFAAAGWLRRGDCAMRLPARGPLAPASVTSVQPDERVVTVYNFEVEDWHTYIAGGFAVHNLKMQ